MHHIMTDAAKISLGAGCVPKALAPEERPIMSQEDFDRMLENSPLMQQLSRDIQQLNSDMGVLHGEMLGAVHDSC